MAQRDEKNSAKATSKQPSAAAGKVLALGEPPMEENPPPQIGRFQIEREIGRGAFSVVYRAFDPSSKRRVALKLPLVETLLAPRARTRFLREMQAVVSLEHPYINPLFEVGEVGSLCYLASAYCPQGTLAEHLDGRISAVPLRQAALLTAQLADAAHYAHQCGIMHLGLKPTNVLLGLPDRASGNDGVDDTGGKTAGGEIANPENEGWELVPLATDFHMASLLDLQSNASLVLKTKTGVVKEGGVPRRLNEHFPIDPEGEETLLDYFVAGADAAPRDPAYISPEQVKGRTKDQQVSFAGTDVYGLGTILYALLTGQPPFLAPGKMEVLRRVQMDEPVRPRRLRPEAPLELEAICLKCLEKTPRRRYVTAAEVGADLRRFLRGQPTTARPLTAAQQITKWARRRPGASALATALGIIILGLAIQLVWRYTYMRQRVADLTFALQIQEKAAKEAHRQRVQTENQATGARRQAYASHIRLAWGRWRLGEGYAMTKLLNFHQPLDGQQDYRDFEWYYLMGLAGNLTVLDGHSSRVQGICFSPDERWCASWSDDPQDASILLSRADRGELAYTIQPAQREPGRSRPCRATFSADGRQLISLHQNGFLYTWDAQTGQQVGSVSSPAGLPLANKIRWQEQTKEAIIEFLPGARGLVYQTGPSQLQRWDWEKGQKGVWPQPVWKSQSGAITALCFSQNRDGRAKTFAVGIHDAANSRFFVEVGAFQDTHAAWEKSFQLSDSPAEICSLSLSDDGKVLAAGNRHGEVRFWNLDTKAALRVEHGQPPEKTLVSISPDGRFAVSGMSAKGSRPGAVKLWDTASGKLQAETETPGPVRCLQFSPQGQMIALGGDDGLLRLWRQRQEPDHQLLKLDRPLKNAWWVASSTDAPWLAAGGDDHRVSIWSAAGKLQATLTSHKSFVSSGAFSRDGRFLATGSFDQTIKLWDPHRWLELTTMIGYEGPVRGVAFGGDGKQLASVDESPFIYIWDLPAGELAQTIYAGKGRIRALLYDARNRLITGDEEGNVIIWDVENAKQEQSWQEASEVHSLALSQDGQRLAVGDKSGVIHLYQMPNAQPVGALSGDAGGAGSIAFSPLGRTLVAGGENKKVTLWQIDSEEALFDMPGIQAAVNGVAFSWDGGSLAAATSDGQVILWRALPGKSSQPR